MSACDPESGRHTASTPLKAPVHVSGSGVTWGSLGLVEADKEGNGTGATTATMEDWSPSFPRGEEEEREGKSSASG